MPWLPGKKPDLLPGIQRSILGGDLFPFALFLSLLIIRESCKTP